MALVSYVVIEELRSLAKNYRTLAETPNPKSHQAAASSDKTPKQEKTGQRTDPK